MTNQECCNVPTKEIIASDVVDLKEAISIARENAFSGEQRIVVDFNNDDSVLVFSFGITRKCFISYIVDSCKAFENKKHIYIMADNMDFCWLCDRDKKTAFPIHL